MMCLIQGANRFSALKYPSLNAWFTLMYMRNWKVSKLQFQRPFFYDGNFSYTANEKPPGILNPY